MYKQYKFWNRLQIGFSQMHMVRIDISILNKWSFVITWFWLRTPQVNIFMVKDIFRLRRIGMKKKMGKGAIAHSFNRIYGKVTIIITSYNIVFSFICNLHCTCDTPFHCLWDVCWIQYLKYFNALIYFRNMLLRSLNQRVHMHNYSQVLIH